MVDEKQKYIIDPLDEFVKYMKKIIRSKKLNKRDVFYSADIPISYGYKLLLGEKRTKQRDIIIRICFVSNFTIKELQEALKLYEMPVLYKKILRDKVILEVFKCKEREIETLNNILIKNKMPELKGCGEDSRNV